MKVKRSPLFCGDFKINLWKLTNVEKTFVIIGRF